MYRYEEIRDLHLELTSRCNVACPQCARNNDGGADNEELPLDELSLDDARAIFPAAFIARLDHMYMCGNYGDALVARDTLEVFRLFRAANPRMTLALHTNASGRAAEWWAGLAALGVKVYFGIDGLADTNHLYRRGADWARVMASVRAFRDAGGRAVWNFIVFKHNEHQVEEAAALSRELGFEQFVAKRTNRFFDGDKLAVVNRDNEFEYFLEMPEGAEWRNQAQSAVLTLSPTERRALLDRVPIECKVAAAKSVYVSGEGLVFPCCFTGHLYTRDLRARQMRELLDEHGGTAAIDARRRPLRDILESPLFQRAFAERWSRPSVAAGRPIICARVCGNPDDNMFAARHVKRALR